MVAANGLPNLSLTFVSLAYGWISASVPCPVRSDNAILSSEVGWNGQASTFYDFRIDAWAPDTLPMSRLADYLAELATRYSATESKSTLSRL